MRQKILFFACLLLIWPVRGEAEETFIDLTHDFSEQTLYWPTAQTFRHETVHYGKTERNLFYAASNFSGAEHGGTHFDAPIHFAEGKQTAEKVPLEKLIGPAVVIDVTRKAMSDRDYRVRVSDFKDWESQYGRIPEKSIVLIRTGFDAFWGDAEKYLGTKERGEEAIKKLHFPGLSVKASQWLIDHQKVKAVGIDTASLDYGQAVILKTHRLLLRHEIPIFENLANLGQLPPKGAKLFALPMKIKDGTGAPLRAVAVIEK